MLALLLKIASTVLFAYQATAIIFHDLTPRSPKFHKRQLPLNATGVKTITSPSGVRIRYKEPGKDGVCEFNKPGKFPFHSDQQLQVKQPQA